MAPEQQSEGIVTVLTAVYGLGATLREGAGRFVAPELAPLLSRMTGLPNERPREMSEVARLLSAIAREHGPNQLSSCRVSAVLTR